MKENRKISVGISRDIFSEIIEHLLCEYLPDNYGLGDFHVESIDFDYENSSRFVAGVTCNADDGILSSIDSPIIVFKSRQHKDTTNEGAFRRTRKMQAKIREMGIEGEISNVKNKKKRPPKKRI